MAVDIYAGLSVKAEIRVQHVQTKREIEATLAAMGLSPRKRFGQHFLIDGNLMRRLIDCAELEPDDVVLEAGGGTGGLTDLLVGRVGHAVCVEIDRQFFALLEDRFAGRGDITLVPGDVLESKHTVRKEVIDAVAARCGRGQAAKLVSNLPYSIATPLLMNLLVDHPMFRTLCFTVQAEVAERLTAAPGCREYGPLSVVVQTLAAAETIAHVPPSAFWPRPAVASSLIRMEVREAPPIAANEAHAFAGFVRGVFDHRRKTLRSALRYVADAEACTRVFAGVDASRRPESFSPKEWLDVFRMINEPDGRR